LSESEIFHILLNFIVNGVVDFPRVEASFCFKKRV